MVGVKGNSRKAGSMKMSTQLLVVFVFAAVVVLGIKSCGTAPWHASTATHTEDQQRDHQSNAVTNASAKSASVADIAVAKEANVDIQDSNLVQFVFSNLDGEEGQEGEVVVKLHPDWAPIGVKRIKELTADSFWDECRAFRVLPNFMVQLGINGDPTKQKKWKHNIEDDPVKASNTRGMVTFAMAGRGTRTTQIFFNTVNNARLDKENFAPFAEVISGMDIIDRIYADYREKPDQGFIQQKGNAYLKEKFPDMSFIKSARFISSTASS